MESLNLSESSIVYQSTKPAKHWAKPRSLSAPQPWPVVWLYKHLIRLKHHIIPISLDNRKVPGLLTSRVIRQGSTTTSPPPRLYSLCNFVSVSNVSSGKNYSGLKPKCDIIFCRKTSDGAFFRFTYFTFPDYKNVKKIEENAGCWCHHKIL